MGVCSALLLDPKVLEAEQFEEHRVLPITYLYLAYFAGVRDIVALQPERLTAGLDKGGLDLQRRHLLHGRLAFLSIGSVRKL